MVAGVDVADPLRGGVGGRWHGGGTVPSAGPCQARPRSATSRTISPTGVPPLELTGERTLPDVPEENYWYRRHLAVYEWIAARVEGMRVVDLACGEGYGSDVLARTRRRGGRHRRQPRGARARPAPLRAAEPPLRAGPGRERLAGRSTPSSSCRRSSTSRTSRRCSARSRAAAPLAFISTPNRLTLAPEGAEKSDNPWHLREYTIEEYRGAARAGLRRGRDPRPLPRRQARGPRAGDRARLGPRPPRAAAHQALLRPLHAGDQRRRLPAARRGRGGPRRGAGLRRGLPPVTNCRRRRTPSASATSPSSCTPTCPTSRGSGPTRSARSGSSTRSIRSHLPVLARGPRRDDDGHPGARRPARGAGRRGAAARVHPRVPGRLGRARRRRRRARACVAACEAEAERYRQGARRARAARRRAARAFAEAGASGRVELVASTATHAVLPLIATREGRMLQLDAGLRSHRRRFGAPRGIWLPECAYEPGPRAPARRARHRALLHRPVGRASPTAPRCGRSPPTARSRSRSTGRRSSGSGRSAGYPSDPRLRRLPPQVAARHAGPGRSPATPYRPEAAAERAREQARGRSPPAVGRAAARPSRGERLAAGLLVFAIDTELLGHWWWEGPDLARGGARGAARPPGVRPLTLSRALAEHEPERRPLRASSWGEGKDMRTWDSPAVADLAWASRRLELRVLREIAAGRLRGAGAGPRGTRAARGAVERLGLPRLPPPGGRLPVPAGARSLPGAVRGHRLRRRNGAGDAKPGAGPVTPHPSSNP